jgi:hypothetical protein
MIMGNKENELAVLPTLNDNDKVRIVTEAGQSAQAKYSDLRREILSRSGIVNWNLLLATKVPVQNDSYMVKMYAFGDYKPVAGELITAQIKGELFADKNSWELYNSGGAVSLVNLNHSDRNADGIYMKTFNWKIVSDSYTASNTTVRVYAVQNSVVGTSSIEWIKLERGGIATPFMPAIDELLNLIP